jgi:ethanolamine utilization protein EutQ (cupin superfamily)
MKKLHRRSALTIGLAAASAAVVKPAGAQTPDYKEKAVSKGVVRRDYGSEHSMIPGFKTVALRDIVVEPGAMSVENNVMPNAMVCHVLEGELEIVQDGKTITGKKNYVWTCDKGTKEHVVNKGKVVAIMRITDLIA